MLVAVRAFLVDAFKIPSASMEGTLLVGDFLFVNRLAYGAELPRGLSFPGLDEPARGDVVVFRPPHDRGRSYVKRLVGLPGDTLRMVNNVEPNTLDAQKAGGEYGVAITQLLGGTLITIDPVTSEYVPYLAESWDVSEDGLEYTFYLKEGVTFHNGDPCTAEDWVYTLQRGQDPEQEGRKT